MKYYSEEDYKKARKKVKAKKGFYSHLTAYLIVNSFLFLMNILTDPSDPWFQYPLLAWGVSLAFHYVGVFGIPGVNYNDSDWEEREIEKELNKMPPTEEVPPTLPEDELELKEFKKLRKEWNDSDFV